MDDDYERILSVKNEVFVYKVPPRQSARAYRAADWKLDQPDWTGRLRIVVVNNTCFIKLEDKTNGELFAQAPIDTYPGSSVEAVSDSSRYFVIKVVDVGGRHAFIGIGFADRGDSFDFNVTLQDHFKREKVEDNATNADATPLDLGFKEGETIKINIGSRAGQDAKAKPKKPCGAGLGILPPPPSGNIPKLAPVPNSGVTHQRTNSGGVTQPPLAAPNSQPIQQTKQSEDFGDFGDFASFSNNSSTQQSTGGQWVTF